MSEMQKQWAIRLPDGALYGRPENYMRPTEVTPLVFDTEEEAKRVLDQLVHSACAIGVHQLAATLTHRYVSEWSNHDVVEGFVAEVEKHLAGGDQ